MRNAIFCNFPFSDQNITMKTTLSLVNRILPERFRRGYDTSAKWIIFAPPSHYLRNKIELERNIFARFAESSIILAL